MKKTFTFLLLLCATLCNAQNLKASFSAAEAMKTYYEQGFDSQEDASKWTYGITNADATWKLSSTPLVNGLDAFSKIDAKSKYSLAIEYGSNTQDETATSPEITILSNSQCQFYSCFSGVWLYAGAWTLYAINTETNDTTKLISQFDWAQENAFTGPNWVKFSYDLSSYKGKKVKFMFRYKGNNGESALIDGFKIMNTDTSESSTISITEGSSVHFLDATTDSPTSWKWEFEGGEPSTSTEQNPVVTYNKAGKYSVKLTASDGTQSSSASRTEYIIVTAEAPKAIIGMPEAGYLSPFVATFVPVGVPVLFKDNSTGKPTSWEWTFQGCDKETSNEQNPVVTYIKKGTYSLSLRVKNAAGIDTDIMQYALQAGGAQYIWNITPEENSNLAKVALGWYGNYAGSNFLGMKSFAEKYAAPLTSAHVDSVAVYFASTSTVSPDSVITVSVNEEGIDGMPGAKLASVSMKASQLVYDASNVVATMFKFNKPVAVDKAFFVVIDGMPSVSNDKGTDDIAILCARREAKGKCTAYHYLEDQDEKGNSLGTYKWFKNTDDPLSMAISPILDYEPIADAISDLHTSSTADGIRLNGGDIILSKPFNVLDIYNMSGAKVASVSHPSSNIDLTAIPAGAYIIKATDGKQTSTLKFVK